MTKQQKRRRKRYEPGSAYAGDVRPTGVLGFLSGANMIKVIFVLMALGVAAGGIVAVISGLSFGSGTNSNPNAPDFVVQGDEDDEPTPTPLDSGEGGLTFTEPPAMTIDTSKSYLATITTDAGEIHVKLFADQAPQTVNNFIFLAEQGFYDELLVDFADPEFSVETGNPTCSGVNGITTCRTDGGPGYDLPQEDPGPFASGTLGMINGSQFFIALTDSSEFESYTPFGEVTSGLGVARRLTQGAQIQSIEISET